MFIKRMATAEGGLLLSLAVVLLSASVGCRQKAQYAAPPPPVVTVAHPVVETITEFAEHTGTTEATESVDVRARVEGFLEQVNFEAGAGVERGELLFIIDPKPFQARLDRAEAEGASRQAELQRATHEYARIEDLHKSGTAAETEWIQAQAAYAGAIAAVQAAQAEVDTARLNLDYTRIVAPISGRISRTLVDADNLVGAGEYTLLTTIVQDDPIYVYFSASEQELVDYLRTHPESRRSAHPPERPKLYVRLINDADYAREGQIDWADTRVDAATGTIMVRGVLPNPDGMLLPGMFVHIKVPQDTRENALLITERAIGADQGGKYVFLVDQEDNVEKRYVETGTLHNKMRLIRSGVASEDWIVTKGVQRVRDGMKVNPVRDQADSPAEELPSAPASAQSGE